jgi:hypothetical protein
MRTGGDGWAAYDRLFREHAALDRAGRMDWTSLDSGLHQATFTRQASSGDRICSHCRETDHMDQECALAPVQDKPVDQAHSPPPPAKRGRTARAKPPQRLETLENICISWNRGNCLFSPCRMQHICASCKKTEHRAKDCPTAAEDSPYKTSIRPGSRTKSS